MKPAEILSIQKQGCVAVAANGMLHISSGPLYFELTRGQMTSFINQLSKALANMQPGCACNKLLLETGKPYMKIMMNYAEVEALVDMMNEAELTLCVREMIQS